MMAKQTFSILSLAFGLLACGKKDQGNPANTGAFLKPADFSNLTYDQLTGVQALKELNDSDEIYDNKPKSASTSAGDGGSTGGDTPFDACLEKNQPTVNVIERSTINVDTNIDLLQCVKEQSGENSQSVEGGQFNIRFLFNISCPGADFSEFQGKKISDVGLSSDSTLPAIVETKCKDVELLKILANASILLKDSGTSENAFEMNIKMGQFTKDGEACTFKKVSGGYNLDGCQQMTHSLVNFGGNSQKKLTVFESVNLLNSLASTSPWFGSGSLNVRINNFSGTLVYSGTDTPPSYSLSGGAETLSGNLTNPTLALESFSRSSSSSRNFLITREWNKLVSHLRDALEIIPGYE